MSAFKDTEIGEIIKTSQDTPQVTPQVEMLDRFAIDSRCYFSNKLTIIWQLFGDSGDYLAISELSARLLGHNWVRNGSNRLKIIPQKSRDIFVTFMGHIGQISDIYRTYNKNAKSVSKGNINEF